MEEEDFQKGEGFDADAEGVLDEDLLEGGDDYNEDELNGEEEQLLDDEPAQGDITGEVEMENEIKEEKEEELYEPSEVDSYHPFAKGCGRERLGMEQLKLVGMERIDLRGKLPHPGCLTIIMDRGKRVSFRGW